ncbi:MAG: hypothetical protein AAGA03_07115 [Planctomycetota bacterium]
MLSGSSDPGVNPYRPPPAVQRTQDDDPPDTDFGRSLGFYLAIVLALVVAEVALIEWMI